MFYFWSDFWRIFLFSSVAQSCLTLCDPVNYSMPGLPVHRQLLESTQTYVHWVGDGIQPCHPLTSPSPPALNPSQIRVYSNESALRIRWPKYWNFSVNISPSNKHSGLISFKMGWLDLLGVQGTLKSLPQHHSSKAWILQSSAFFIVQLSHFSVRKKFSVCSFISKLNLKKSSCPYQSVSAYTDLKSRMHITSEY